MDNKRINIAMLFLIICLLFTSKQIFAQEIDFKTWEDQYNKYSDELFRHSKNLRDILQYYVKTNDLKGYQVTSIFSQLAELDQLTLLGYQVIDGTSAADLQVQMEIEQDNGTFTGNIPMLSTTTTTGNVGGINVTGYSTTTQMVPYTESYSYTKTRILFSDSKNGSIVWDCFLSIETKDYNEYFMKALQEALNHLGKDYEGKYDL
jgi:hypothetical protein